MLANWMKHNVDVQRPTATKGSSGGEIDTYTTVYDNLACFIQPIATNWLVQYQQRGIEVSHTVGTNRNPTIREGDRILFGSRVFLVKGIRNIQESGLQTLVDCLELLT